MQGAYQLREAGTDCGLVRCTMSKQGGGANTNIKAVGGKVSRVESSFFQEVLALEAEMSNQPNPDAAAATPVIMNDNRCSMLGTVFQLISDGVLVWNAAGHVVECSPAAEVLLGYHRGGLLDRPIEEILRGTVADTALLQRADGAQIECDVEIRKIDHPHGEMSVCVLRPNPLARRETSRGLGRHVVERVSDVIFQFDAAGRWVFANQSWTALTGWSLQETLRHSLYRTIAPADVELVRENISALLSGQRPHARIAVRVITATNHTIWVELAMRVASIGGSIEGIVGTMTDITEKRAAEEALRVAKTRAESALSTKDLFLANMSHEIRTPMNAVIALTGLLLETPLSDSQRDFVETIRASGDTLLTIINEILDFSKVESENFTLEETDFNLAEVVEGALDLVATSPKALDLELMLRIGPAVPAIIKGDPTRLRQILVNLASNALKFTARGHVALAIDLKRIEGKPWLRFEVTDTGIGIPADRRERLFTPFTQVDASTTRQFGGTGLGLAICRKLVSFMGGSIDLTSTVGVGSTFFFEIPLINSVSKQVVAKPPTLGGHSVRVMHPYKPAVDHLSAMIARAGGRVAPTGAEALVLDEHADKLEEHLCRSPVPVVLTVTKARRAAWNPLVDKAKQLGTSVVVVSKPVRYAQFVGAVSSLFADTIRMDLLVEPSGVLQLPSDTQPLRLLVAEDNVVNQKVAIALLAKFGYKPDVVSNGVEALLAVRQKKYDVVFLDVQMPEMDGLEAARRIVGEFPLHSRPILIAMTANVTPSDRAECAAAGCELYVAKPVKVAELEVALKTVQVRIAERNMPEVTLEPNSRLADLAEEVGRNLVAQIVQHFIDDADARIVALQAAVVSRDAAAIARAAHVLRSAAVNIGLRDLADVCAQLENAERAGSVDLSSLMERAHRQMRADVAELNRYVASV